MVVNGDMLDGSVVPEDEVAGAPATAEGDLLLGRELLIAEDEYEVIWKGGLHLFEVGVIEICEVDTADFGAETSRERLRINRHGPSLVVRCRRAQSILLK